jgi:4-hydroxybenzoate polyprenyltransferase
MTRFIEKLESVQMSFGAWLATFTGIVTIRFFLETFSSPMGAFPGALDMATAIHYFIWFLGVFVSITLVLRIFLDDIAKIGKLVIFSFLVIWVGPVVDLVSSGGAGYMMAYIFTGGHGLLLDFLALGGTSPFGGITVGIKTEIIIVLIGVVTYVFLKTRNFLKAIGAAVLSYVIIFVWLALPSFLAIAISRGAAGIATSAQIFNFLVGIFAQSHIPGNIIRPSEQLSYAAAISAVFNAGISYLFYIITSVLIVAWAWVWRPRVVRAMAKNSRLRRLFHYWLMIATGIAASFFFHPQSSSWNIADGMAIVVMAITFACAWLFAVGTNDLADIAIDAVANTERPLVTGDVTKEEIKPANIVLLIWSLTGAFILGYWTLFLVACFTAAYYVYSVPPLRLKRVPILATLLISLACLAAVMAGFFFANPIKIISDFPRQLLLIIVIGFTLAANIKDIKDIAGDRADGIMTILTVFGEKVGVRIVGVLLGLSFLVAPAVFRSVALLLPSVIAAVLGYRAAVALPYREWRIFGVYFVYVAVIAGILFIEARPR